MLRVDQWLHLPDQMDMVAHDNKCKKFDALICYQEPKTVYNNVFVCVMFQKFIPSFYRGSKELRVFCNKSGHLLNVRRGGCFFLHPPLIYSRYCLVGSP